ncbi:tRNA (adenosine(37)-N6)-threonylcarbamoyltransferase complex ATPase subunit type 1 TsaE [Candidatus Parabeggiatoa sp. HSG14]|uniref:tRNA (adenosine(37)-N6)-threonylcarbamoyltransferase complex ATPase subunit type 1 TsaE n=1 Tax=Candidatus Parabeggiatoa sp. HSG14 TaxID=3055593 RepID=UPI0025A71581|nr:tRNA (adenosine(37)-N6)-threonylcarbamoyltransferase complex ATPase subunit type 1 TsaE [Thiotrichales bacterium HSG14]
MTHLITESAAMEDFGGHLAHACHTHSVLHLCGELGVGKTTLVRGFLKALGHKTTVKSPTYTLVEPYQLNKRMIYHFDFYRLGDPEELEYMGIRDYLEGNIICLIEWPEKGGQFTPLPDIKIQLFHHAESRLLEIKAYSIMGQSIIANLSMEN